VEAVLIAQESEVAGAAGATPTVEAAAAAVIAQGSEVVGAAPAADLVGAPGVAPAEAVVAGVGVVGPISTSGGVSAEVVAAANSAAQVAARFGAALAGASGEVHDAGAGGDGRPAEAPGLVYRRRLGLDVEPAWADHAFFRQREGWPHPEDRFPLVPMTGIVELLAEAAAELHPDLVVVAVEEATAFRWLAVDPAVEVTVRATTVAPIDAPQPSPGTPVRVRASIDGHARATVVLAPDYPPAPTGRPPRLRNERPSHIEADRFYADRHMFHGPAYQGVRAFLALGDDGSRAIVKSLPAPGALLDNAGQLMGHWLSSQVDGDRLVLPTSIGRIELFGPHPPAGTLVDCTMVVTHLDEKVLRGDHVLIADDRLWCRITGWEDRRFPTDTLVFETLQWPERTGMSVEHSGYTRVDERWSDAATRALVMRRYLSHGEQADYERLHPLAQRQFLLGRIAVKDAVRRRLWAGGHGPLFPAEVAVANDPAGRPLVRGPFVDDLRVSLSHVDGVGVALVGVGVDVGIDVERIEPRRPSFEALVLTGAERSIPRPEGFDRDAWLTVLWAAKEAAAKATGRGLQGRPKDFEVTERRGRRLRIHDRWVAFERLPQGPAPHPVPRKEQIVAWTVTDD
jgi:phosphopantetheinyl transferase